MTFKQIQEDMTDNKNCVSEMKVATKSEKSIQWTLFQQTF